MEQQELLQNAKPTSIVVAIRAQVLILLAINLVWKGG